MKNGEEGMEKLLNIEKALNGMMETHKLVVELKELESEQQKRIKALEESERRYRIFLKCIPLRFWVKDTGLLYLYCSEQYARDLKKRPEEIVGKGDGDFFPAEVAERYRSEEQKILETGTVEETEEAYAPGGGQELMVRKMTSPIRDERGGVIGILNIFWDITEQRRNEEELRKYRGHLEELLSDRTSELQRTQERLQWEVAKVAQTEDQLRRLDQKCHTFFEDTGLAMAVMGVEDMILSETNREFRMLFGTPGAEGGPRNLSEFVCPDDLERIKEDYSAWRGSGDPRPGRKEYDFIDTEGKKRRLALSLAMIPENQKVIASFLDFTQLRQTEDDLRRSEERHRSLFENAPIAISVIQDGMIKYMNLKGINLFGRSREEVSSRPALDLTHPEFREDFQGHVKRVENGGGPMIYAWPMAPLNGKITWLESRMVNIRWEGEPAVLNFMTDVTAFKEIMEEVSNAVKPFRLVVDATEKISRLWTGREQE